MCCFIKKVTWVDECGGELVNIREIEYKYEPYFKVFMCYKEYDKYCRRLRHISQICFNDGINSDGVNNDGVNNDETIKRRLSVISNHIQCINDFKIISKKWLEMCHEFPYLSDLVVDYDVV